jgi:DNA helicase II / ATP-dependent DNA helicase PcrA
MTSSGVWTGVPYGRYGRGVDPGEPADLLGVYGRRRTVARWWYRAEHSAFDEHLSFGWLPDGRRWVDATGLRDAGRIFSDDASARAYAEALMARPREHPGEWVGVVAEPGAAWPVRTAGAPPHPPGDARPRGRARLMASGAGPHPMGEGRRLVDPGDCRWPAARAAPPARGRGRRRGRVTSPTRTGLRRCRGVRNPTGPRCGQPGGLWISPCLTYDQLVPAARQLLAIPTIAEHYAGRYGVVICDEFQDTDGDEWAFLQAIAPTARRILLGDVNQCIYGGFKPGVNPAARIAAALAIPGAVAIDLPAASHRDPTGVLPAAAEAARQRRFDDPAIKVAASSGRLSITRIISGNGHAEVIDLAREARAQAHTVSIFTHTIAATTSLSDALRQAGLNHEQVGFGHAYGEALPAQLALVQYALGDNVSPRRPLAVFTAACNGGNGLPPVATQMLNKSNPTLERAIQRLAGDLRATGGATPDLDRLADVVATAARIGTIRGQETWSQAAQRTRRALRAAKDQTLAGITTELMRARDEPLVGNHTPPRCSIEVMNLHRTKGREADNTNLLLGPDEYYGSEGEPFPDGSQLLYVVMTRARRQAHIVVTASAHPLWQPLVAACEAARALPAGSA